MKQETKQTKSTRHLDRENRVIYDRETLEAISISEVTEEHPEWIKAKQEEVGRSEERIQNLIYRKTIGDIVARMAEEDGGHTDNHYNLCAAKRIMEDIQPELLPNIHEWIENRPLTKIKIHGMTVEKIMHQFEPHRTILFIEAIECMICWKKTNYKHKDFCRLFFMSA
jgi:hypothetical protein